MTEEKCQHQFQFSHQAAEPRGVPAVYMTIFYSICLKCGELSGEPKTEVLSLPINVAEKDLEGKQEELT